MKLRHKLNIGIIFAATLPALLIAALHSVTYLRNAETAYDANISAFVQNTAKDLDELMQNMGRDTQSIAISAPLQKGGEQTLSQQLAAYTYVYPYFSEILWADPRGTVLASSDSAHLGQALPRLYPELGDDLPNIMQAPAGVLHISDFDGVAPDTRAGIAAGRAKQEALRLQLLLRVDAENGKPHGVLVAVVNSRAVVSVLQELQRRLPDGAPVLLLDRRGEILLSSDPATAPLKLHPLAGLIAQKLNPATGRSVLFEAELDGRKLDFIAAETSGIGLAHAASWRLLAWHSDAVFLATARRTLYQTMALLAAITAAGGLLGIALARSIVRPIEALSAAATRIGAGDLTARAAVSRGDEVGEMAQAFNSMAETIEREHNELVLTAVQLERHNHETDLRNDLGDLLQSCYGVEEAGAAIARFAPQLFDGASGAVYLATPGAETLTAITSWGEGAADYIAISDCWALRRGKTYLVTEAGDSPLCPHLGGPLRGASICVPLAAHGETLGLLHMTCPAACEPGSASMAEKQELAEALAAQAGMALGNLRLRETLRQQSIRDVLTGLYNRRYLEDALPRELSRAQRAGQTLAAFMLDVDHFKKFNDDYGHEAGDAVLKALGKALHDNCRQGDSACRFGGEEFTVILSDTDLAQAREWGERLMGRVRAMEVKSGSQALPRIAISMGLALYPEHGSDAETLLQAADLALYDAKHAGRDRLVVSGEGGQSPSPQPPVKGEGA